MALIISLFVIGALYNQVSSTSNAGSISNVGIIGGHQIPIEDAPYMATLHRVFSDGHGSHTCGASIIHERYLLTAAHCVISHSTPKFEAYVGTNKCSGDGGELVEVEEVIVHDGFSFETAQYDVSLIKLKKPLSFGSKVAKIKLATPGFTVPDGSKLNATGWGRTSTESYSGSKELLQVKVPKMNNKKCHDLYLNYAHNITTRMICAGSHNHSSCHGDSGGPLNFGDIQVGITSFGKSCGDDPGIYTKVASVFCWIMEKIYLSK